MFNNYLFSLHKYSMYLSLSLWAVVGECMWKLRDHFKEEVGDSMEHISSMGLVVVWEGKKYQKQLSLDTLIINQYSKAPYTYAIKKIYVHVQVQINIRNT